MPRRLATVDTDDGVLRPAFKVPEASLPERLSEGELSATIATAIVGKLDTSIAAAGARPAPPATVATNIYLGTTSRRVVGTELDRVSLILKAPAAQDMLVAPGALNSTTDPGSGYVTVAAGSEILINDVLPVWAYLATSAEAVAMTKGMVA